ncbi:MAG: CHAT domain-containing protein [Rhodocyclaceae bacterium]
MPDIPQKLLLPLAHAERAQPASLPAVLTDGASRGEGLAVSLLPNVSVENSWSLQAASRSADAPGSIDRPADERLLALEAQDGTTIFIRADALARHLAQVQPQTVDEQGNIDLARFRDPEASSRGLADWVWKRVSELKLSPDDITALAKQKLTGWLADKALGKLEDELATRASTLGARALMQAIEERLAGEPGLYQWKGTPPQPSDLCRAGDARLKDWSERPALLFIHGTASHTVGSFGAVPGTTEWRELDTRYEGRIFGLEHRTFSESPIDNALALVDVLPDGAHLHLVTHSRGGLVGDLLCLGTLTGEMEQLIRGYRRVPGPHEAEREQSEQALRDDRERVAEEEQAKLRELVGRLEAKRIVVERYVRVAAPAAGTTLLSENLDVFLSSLLELIRRGVTLGAGAAAGAIGGPAAATLTRQVLDRGLKLAARVVVEIAAKRVEPQVVPGIEAMLPEAPMGAFLARAARRPDIQMAVIAGDIEGGNLLKRIGVMFTDWMLFDRADNDLVVNTRSMYAGVAARGAHAMFVQGAQVSHFSYFGNRDTRLAMQRWLTDRRPELMADWSVLASAQGERAAVARGGQAPVADNTRPVVIYLPGILGSDLEIGRRNAQRPGSGDRIWLDFVDLAIGGLNRIAIEQAGVEPCGVVGLVYGKLANHLESTHRVIRFAYDWRRPVSLLATQLIDALEVALKAHPDQPVRILAHSMGGLVVREALRTRPDLWERIVARPGGRLLMLGTPNHGSYLMVETLLGRSDTIRTLGRLDLANGLQRVLDIVARFPGALQLLPRPEFVDLGGKETRDFFSAQTWAELADRNDDGWFGRNLGGKPIGEDLKGARDGWTALAGAAPLPHTERISYIYGQAANTPCGLNVPAKGRLAMLGTPHGDGSVTWASGKLDWLPDERCWLMPVDHAGLVNTPAYFDEIDSLLASGRPARLDPLPQSRGMAPAPVREYQPVPMPGYPTERDLVSLLIGGNSQSPKPQARRLELQVLARAGDLRYLAIPIMCGHYIGDPMAGAEREIDRDVVDGALSLRERMGVHAGPLGSASLALMPRSPEDMLQGTGRGALVVGLGQFGELSAGKVREAVRAGVLRLLLHATDWQPEQMVAGDAPVRRLRLASVLIGYNSTATTSVDEAVAAVTLGVLEANRQFADGSNRRQVAQVTSLEFIEQFEDVAVTAAHAVAALPVTLKRTLDAWSCRLSAARELRYGEGVRQRLSVAPSSSYWPRLMVTDARQREGEVAIRYGGAAAPQDGAAPAPAEAAWLRYPAELKYLYLSERARAETVVQQRQPGLVEKLVTAETRATDYNPSTGFGRTLFHLLVPLGFKGAAREAHNLMLVVDAYTANLPWEMMVTDGEPMVLRTRVVRMLATRSFRAQAQLARQHCAYVISNPSTEGYYREFGGTLPAPVPDRLATLSGASEEGDAVAGVLSAAKYAVVRSADDSRATDVISRLYQQPYRILVISAHGMFEVLDRQGMPRSGVVLSDGLMLTAAEVQQMETVPEVVFLSCCHLGAVNSDDGWAPNKLAYSLARELIEMGVRCVVAAGWAVDDQAAKVFATTFFDAFVTHNESFGEAVFRARRECYARHPGKNTWGAYQAYGDPGFTLQEQNDAGVRDFNAVSPAELIDWLTGCRLQATRKGALEIDALRQQIDKRLSQMPPEWGERVDVLLALAGVYAAYDEVGFQAATDAYLAAIRKDTIRPGGASGSLRAIEQLATVEARSGEMLARQHGADADALIEARQRIERAVDRLNKLIELAAVGGGAQPATNTERYRQLGSAYKRLAFVLYCGAAAWPQVEPVLRQARDAYMKGGGDLATEELDPHALLNGLQLDVVLGTASDVDPIELAARCVQVARQRFEQSFDSWSGIQVINAELTTQLVSAVKAPTGRSAASKKAAATKARQAATGKKAGDIAQDFLDAYRREADRQMSEPRLIKAVVEHLTLLADMLALRIGTGGSQQEQEQAALLRALADKLLASSLVARAAATR